MKGPIAIGGVGGSGTRVVARMLHDVDFYMGSHLNDAYDNLWFTLLLRRTYWLEKANEKEIQFAIQLFDEAMKGKLKPDFRQRVFILNAVAEYIRRHYIKGEDWRSLPLAISKSLHNSKNNSLQNYSRWGWKEPNTHLFLKALSGFYPDMKYIHVIRHGLDMAFSNNQIQLRNFGKRYSVDYPSDVTKLPAASLEFWIRSNRKAIDTATTVFGKNFLLINFELLCSNPEKEMRKFFDFVEVNIDEKTFHQFCKVPKMPISSGRYRVKGLSAFSKEQLDAVKQLGYDISI